MSFTRTTIAPCFGFLGLQLRSRLLHERRPLLASFKPSYACNLQCLHCPFWKKEGPQLDFAGATAILRNLHNCGVKIVVFEGGEPLLWRSESYTIEDLVTYAKTLFWSVGITTNGTLPLPESPDVVWVSIDGFRQTTERIRGPVFDRQMTNICGSQHPRLFANITISRLNAHEVPDLVKFLSAYVRGITIQFFYPYQNDSDLFLPYKERTALLNRLLEMKETGYPLLNSRAALSALRSPGWRCYPWLIANANPDGSITQGCYLKGRTHVACAMCGFSVHTEMSLAYDLNPGAIMTGLYAFGLIRAIRPLMATRIPHTGVTESSCMQKW